jgi:site-specific recombinase XerC
MVWSKETDVLLNKYLGVRLNIDTKTDALFIRGRSDNASHLTVRSMERWVEAIVVNMGLDSGITPHSFRHGKGHHILNTSGGNVRDIFAILRHVRPESSFHYLSLNQDQFLQTAVKYLAA